MQTAVGISSITLMDAFDNCIILNNVCYVPASEDRILSMMKFKKEHQANFQFTGLETFCMTTDKGFKLTGHSINDILHAMIPLLQANIAVTHGTTKFYIVEVLSNSNAASDADNSISKL